MHLRAREPSDSVLDVRNAKIVDRANPSTARTPYALWQRRFGGSGTIVGTPFWSSERDLKYLTSC